MSGWIVVPLLLLLVLPAFFIGGVHTLTQAGFGLLAGGLVLVLVVRMRSRSNLQERRVVLDAWFWLFSLAFCYTAYQLLPLPLSWLALLAPQHHEVLRQTLGTVGPYESYFWQPLSLAPAQTAAKLLRDVAVLLTYVAVLQWASQRSRVRMLMEVAVGAAVVLCGVMLFQTVLGLSHPAMGLYPSPSQSTLLLVGSPFLNPHHLAGYLLFHALLALPLFINNINPTERWGWASAFFILSITLFLTLSPFAIFLLFVGLAGFLWCLGHRLFAKNQEDPTELHPAYAPLPFLNISPATAERLSTEQAIAKYPSLKIPEPVESAEEAEKSPKKRSKKNYQKSSRDPQPVWKGWKLLWQNTGWKLGSTCVWLVLGLGVSWLASSAAHHYKPQVVDQQLAWKDQLDITRELVKHYPVWGVGRGAMPVTWPRFSSEQSKWHGQKTITHIESQGLQPIIDWGLFFGVFFLLGCGFLLWRLWQRCQGMMERGLWLALVSLFLQNLQDFNLAFLGTALPWFIFLAALARLQDQRISQPKRYPLYVLAVIGVVGLVVLVVLAPYSRKYDLQQLPHHVASLDTMTPAQQQSHIQSLVRHYPSDYLLAAFLTQHYISPKHRDEQKAIQWSKVGLFLNPTAADIHLMRGYLFARSKDFPQATSALDQSVRLRPTLLSKAIDTVVQFNFARSVLKYSKHPDFAVEIFPHLCQTAPDRCTSDVHEFAAKFPQNLRVQQERTLWYSSRLASRYASWKQQPSEQLRHNLQRYREQIEQQLQDISRVFPQQSASFEDLIRGHLALYQDQADTAASLYQRVLDRKQGQEWLAFLGLYQLYARSHNNTAMQSLFRQVRPLFRSPQQLAFLAYKEGQFLELHGHSQQALIRYGEATQLDSQDSYWLAMAELCKRLKEYRCTIRIYQRLSQKPQYHYLKPEIEKLKPDTIMPP